MNKGKEIAIGTLPEIKKMCGAVRYTIEFKVEEAIDFKAVKNNGNLVAQTNSFDEFNMITGWVAKHNGKIIDIKTAETSLEEIFLKLMN